MRGFYRSKYTDPNSPGTEKYAATTQFEVLCVMMSGYAAHSYQ